MATPPDTTFDLHLPAGHCRPLRATDRQHSREQARLVALSSRGRRRHAWPRCAHLSRHVADLAEANEMRPDQPLSGTEALVVPVAPVATPSLHTLVYTTRRGDTLVSIADRFGVSLDQLRRWNKIPSGIRVTPDAACMSPSRDIRAARRRPQAGAESASCREAQCTTASEARRNNIARRLSSQSFIVGNQGQIATQAACRKTKIGMEPHYILVFSCALLQAIATMASACGGASSAAPTMNTQRQPLEAMDG